MQTQLITKAVLVLGLTVHIIAANAADQTQANANNGSTAQKNNNHCACTSETMPMTEANQSDAAILIWANEVAVSSFSFNFVNYQSQIRKSSEFFTAQGWDEYASTLEKSHILDLVKTKKMVASAFAMSPPIIMQKGILKNAYSWKVEIPMMITYQNSSEFQQTKNIVTLLITRAPALNAPRGIAVAEFTVVPQITRIIQ